ncbi:hypothetical protein [Sulfitobacter sp. 1A15106]|uniref:hypothetical protein n=1 Tax=Sulfitobacter sp. 1A15106 TaxID=3368590 RepID=UPI003744DBE6
MFPDFSRVSLHVICAPSGRYLYVGNVPEELCLPVPSTRSDRLSGRAFEDAEGNSMTMRPMSFATEAEAVAFADLCGFTAKTPVAA